MARDRGGYNANGGRIFGGPHLAPEGGPIFDYLNLVQRHYSGRKPPRADLAKGVPLAPKSRSLVVGRNPEGNYTAGLSWSGSCPGCGRHLISAVHKATIDGGPRADAFYCTRACRAAHSGATTA